MEKEIVSRHRLFARRGEDHRAPRAGPARRRRGHLRRRWRRPNVNVDMIVQNVSADGTTDMTFTVGKADLPRAAGGAGRAARPRSATPSCWPTRTSPRSASSASACAATPASPARCSSALADKGDQHPGDLHQRDQGQRADRRRIHRAGGARAAYGLRPRCRLTSARRGDAGRRGARRAGPAVGARHARSSAREDAIMGGAMSWVSERHLVAAISNAGGFGVIACGSMSPELLAARDRRHPGADRPARSAST